MVTATGHDEGDHEMTETKETLDRDLLLQIYETVARIRAFDDKAQALISKAEAFFIHYPVRGHEIISAAVAAAHRARRLHDGHLPRHGRRDRQGRAAARDVGRDARQADRAPPRAGAGRCTSPTPSTA